MKRIFLKRIENTGRKNCQNVKNGWVREENYE